MNKKRNDIILIAGVVLTAMAIFFGMKGYQEIHTKQAEAVITIDGREYGRYPLAEDRTLNIKADDESYNILEIKDGAVSITEASCPDKICVEHFSISKTGETIVCLPNKFIVTIENGKEAEMDMSTH